MVEHIEREKALRAIYELSNKEELFSAAEGALDKAFAAIEEIPVANVRPEIHGKWLYSYDDQYGNFAKCSICGYTRNPATQTGWSYCPSCGTKMDLDNSDEEG